MPKLTKAQLLVKKDKLDTLHAQAKTLDTNLTEFSNSLSNDASLLNVSVSGLLANDSAPKDKKTLNNTVASLKIVETKAKHYRDEYESLLKKSKEKQYETNNPADSSETQESLNAYLEIQKSLTTKLNSCLTILQNIQAIVSQCNNNKLNLTEKTKNDNLEAKCKTFLEHEESEFNFLNTHFSKNIEPQCTPSLLLLLAQHKKSCTLLEALTKLDIKGEEKEPEQNGSPLKF